MKKFKRLGLLTSVIILSGAVLCLNSQDSKGNTSRQIVVSTAKPQEVRMEHIVVPTKCKTYDELKEEKMLLNQEAQVSNDTLPKAPTELTAPVYEEPEADPNILGDEVFEEEQEQSKEIVLDNAYSSIIEEVSESKIAIKSVPETIENLDDKYTYYSVMFDVDPGILKAMCSQECGGDLNCTGAAKGVAQIEDSVVGNFIKFGRDVFGQEWSENDRYNTNCAIAFMAYTLSTYLQHYNGDYCKAIQAYNFSHYSLDKLISVYGDDWIDYRDEIAYVNGHYNKTGRTSYGDSEYLEHVLRYYHPTEIY